MVWPRFVILSAELHKEVELKRFVAQLKKELLSVDGPASEEEGRRTDLFSIK